MFAIEEKKGESLMATGIETACLTAFRMSMVRCSTSSPVSVGVRGEVVDVQLEGVGPRVLHQLGVADPAA